MGWATQSYEIAVADVYPGFVTGSTPSSSYDAKAIPAVETNMNLGAARLANLIETIYGSSSLFLQWGWCYFSYFAKKDFQKKTTVKLIYQSVLLGFKIFTQKCLFIPLILLVFWFYGILSFWQVPFKSQSASTLTEIKIYDHNCKLYNLVLSFKGVLTLFLIFSIVFQNLRSIC